MTQLSAFNETYRTAIRNRSSYSEREIDVDSARCACDCDLRMFIRNYSPVFQPIFVDAALEKNGHIDPGILASGFQQLGAVEKLDCFHFFFSLVTDWLSSYESEIWRRELT